MRFTRLGTGRLLPLRRLQRRPRVAPRTRNLVTFSPGLLLACLLVVCSAVPRADTALPAAAIATAHPLATDAGVSVLSQGGNAFDAAVAVTATLGVVEPYSSGLGGGGFWLLHRASDGYQTMVDGRETAPQAAHRDMYLSKAGEVLPRQSVDGPLSAGIPGVPAALEHIARRYGRLPLAKSLQPAIELARRGFAVTPEYRRMAGFRLSALEQSPAAAAVFLDQGTVPDDGYLIRQPDLGRTLEAIAGHGGDGFYRGPVAAALVQGVRQAGGIWTVEDLHRYKVVERRPVSGSFKDLRIVSASPPSSGGVALVTMLNVLAGFDLAGAEPVTRTHLIVEAMRLAYRDRAEHLGDPDFIPVPTERLTGQQHADALRRGIRLDRATASAALGGPGPEGADTSHFSIIDRHGNRVAATLSINYPFGSAFMPAGTGVLLNDEMDDFSAKPGAPNVYGLVGGDANAIAPGKRPLSSMSPTFVESQRGVAILGTPGGSRIISMVLLGILDLSAGRGPDSWVALPRFHHQYLPDVVQHEPGALDEPLRAALRELGHRLHALSGRYGNMQAVYWDRLGGQVLAASDPRGQGKALVWRGDEGPQAPVPRQKRDGKAMDSHGQ